MNKKNLIAAGVAVVLLAGIAGYFGYNTGLNLGTAQVEKKADAPAAAPGQLSWSFEEIAPQDEASAPQTKVTLTAEGNGQKYEVGTYNGSCSVIEGSSWQLLEGEKTGVICWWAGGGNEIAVFEEDGKLVVKTGDIEEGNEETEGFRGNFKLLLPLN
jgi:hypothetical protein